MKRGLKCGGRQSTIQPFMLSATVYTRRAEYANCPQEEEVLSSMNDRVGISLSPLLVGSRVHTGGGAGFFLFVPPGPQSPTHKCAC